MFDEKNSARTEDAKRADVEEMIKTLLKLPASEREKLFYMMKGVELTVERVPERKAV